MRKDISITDLIAEARRNIERFMNDREQIDLDAYSDLLSALEAVTVPTDDYCEAGHWLDGAMPKHKRGETCPAVPTENEREALAKVIMEADSKTIDYDRKWPLALNADGSDNFYAEQWKAYLPHADAILARFRLPVPVEPKWAYRHRATGATWLATSRADAERYCLADPKVFSLVRRAVVGKWEAVEPEQGGGDHE